MDLSTTDIFAGLAIMAVLVAAGAVVHVRKQPPAAAPPARPDETGRHHVPRGLLDDPTTRLKPPYSGRP